MEKTSASRHSLTLPLLATWLLLATASCTASVGSDQNPATGPGNAGANAGAGGPSGTSGNSSGGAGVSCDATGSAPLGFARVWRLTDEQYVNAVRDTFGVTMPAEITGVAETTGEYVNYSEAAPKIDLKIATLYQTAAHQAAVTASKAHLKTFLSCGEQAPSDVCVTQLIKNRVSRAFGRPLAEDEVQGLLGVYKASGTDGPTVGVQLVIEAALQAPSFLYRSELGPQQAGGPTGKVTLTPHEIASAMSFALMDSVPDDALWATAQDGSLADPAVRAAQVERLLALPAVQKNLSHKAGFWLGVERLGITHKDETFPEYTAQVQADLYKSTQLFVEEIFSKGTVTDLLTSKRMYLNEPLAKLYNITGTGLTGSELKPVDVQAPERAMGILSQPGVISAFSRPNRGDPIHRGLFIYNSLVCGRAVGAPPPGATQVDTDLPKDMTERQRAEYRATHTCRACHAIFDPLGLASEKYDAIGRYSETDANGAPIDSTSTITNLSPELDGPITGLPDVAARLKVGRRVSDCAVTNLTQYALGAQQNDKCALQTVQDKFATTGSFADYYRALFNSPGFVVRDAAWQN